MKHVKSFMAAVMVLAALVFLTGCTESNEKKYSKAQSLMASGQYTEAAATFDELGSYEEATKLSMYCKAAAAGESGDYETALSTFQLLGNYKESEFMITYYAARQEESWSTPGLIRAARTYDSIALFRDSKDRAEACRKSFYDSAVALADSGDYAGAVQMLESLRQDNYSDSPQLQVYYSAFGLEKESRYLEASAAFAKLGEYKDSKDQATLVLQRAYDAASSLEAEGKQQEAYNIFISLGDFKDSFERACKPYYVKGEELRTAQDWEGAVAAFIQAGSYSDAATQILATRYAEGEAKRAVQDWDGAVKAFGQAGSYSDAATRALETRYAEGEAKRAVLDWDGAVAAFEQAGSYRDASTQILATRYAEGEAKRATQDWDGAVTAFEQTGNHSDATIQIQETRYQQASDLLISGKYAEAYATFLMIRGYKDVDRLLADDANLIAAAAAVRIAPYKTVGSIVTLGTYEQDSDAGNGKEPIEWVVLDYEAANNRALLLSRYGLDAKPYNAQWTGITWEQCTLRTWLNGEFLTAAFTAEEQKAIVTTTVDNSESQGYSEWNTKGGNNTQDKLFLLSYAEANRYLDVTYDNIQNMKSRVSPTAYAIRQGAYTSSINKTADGSAAGWWWLRSPGDYQHYAYAACVGYFGSLYCHDVSFGSVVVRPALWVNLESLPF